MKKFRTILTLLTLLLGYAGISAQTYQKVTGTVLDENNAPMAGVTISVNGTGATLSTGDGTFTLTSLQRGAVVSFSFIGYKTKNVPVTDETSIQAIRLEPTSTTMSEVTVVGYGKQERRDITGSVSSVKLDEQKPFLSVDQLLQGRAPGVFVSNSSGALGGANLLTIRGVSSIVGENNPLYVVDGVPIYGTDRAANSVGTHGGSISAYSFGGTMTGGGSLTYNTDLQYDFEQNPLLSINPEDIESIEILKDAFATSIYGSRGSAGVILITTKSGSHNNKPSVNVSYTLSLDNPIGKLDLLNGDEYAMIYNQYYPSDKYPTGYNTDWIDAVTRTAISHNTSMSISGGTGRTRYFLSLSYANNESYIINNDMQRYSARLNLDTELSKTVTTGANVSISFVDNNAMQAPTIYKHAITRAPNLPIYNADGSYYMGHGLNTKGENDNFNPVAEAMLNTSKSKAITTVGNAYLQYDPLEWLELKTELGINIANNRNNTYKPELPKEVAGLVPNNQASESNALKYRIVTNNTITINKVFNNDHYLQAVLGQSYEIGHEHSSSIYGSDFFSSDMKGIGAAQTKRVGSAGEDTWALLSGFARVNYQWLRRYLFGVSYRIDGSSRYNRNHRFINIPSVSAAWRLSEEDFIRYNAPWIEEMKVRASIGWTSQDANNSYYGAQAIYVLNTASSFGGSQYLSMSQPSNINLNWEKTITYDVGLDFEAWEGRVNATVDYYYKRTSDMLFSSDLPAYTGYSTQLQNIADMQNQGIEVQLITDNIVTKNFKWQSILNMSHNSNKILKLNFEGNQLDQANSSFKYYAEGEAMAQWYLHEWVGVDPMTGDPLWRLADGTVTTTPPAANYSTSQANKKVYGTAEPAFYGSFTNILTWKGFELSLMFTYSVGGHMINSTQANLLTYATENANNLSRDILDFWQIPGQNTDIPKLRNKSIMSGYDYTSSITTTRFLEKNSYLRLKTLEFSYSLPKRLLQKSKTFTQVKLFTVLTNLFTVSPYSGLDPEVSAFGSSATAAGYDNMTMPASRSYQFGVRLSL